MCLNVKIVHVRKNCVCTRKVMHARTKLCTYAKNCARTQKICVYTRKIMHARKKLCTHAKNCLCTRKIVHARKKSCTHTKNCVRTRKIVHAQKIIHARKKLRTHAKNYVCTRNGHARILWGRGVSGRVIMHPINYSWSMSHFKIWYPRVPKGTLGT